MDNPLVQPDPGLYIWTITTFLVLVALLARFAWRPLLAALAERQQTVQRSLDEARQARQELDRVQVESARILAEARAKADEILSSTRSAANRFHDEVKEKARADAAAIVSAAERNVERETRRALQEVRREAIEIAFDVASKLLQRHVEPADQDRLLQDTLTRLATLERPN
jgi:F-type H+-transporting ATPase subunit b